MLHVWILQVSPQEGISLAAAVIALSSATISYITYRLNRRATSLSGWLEIVELVGSDTLMADRRSIYSQVLVHDGDGGHVIGRKPLKQIEENCELLDSVARVSVNLERASYIIQNGFVNKNNVMEIFADVFVNLGYAVAEYNAKRTKELGSAPRKDFQRRYSRKFILQCAKWMNRKGYGTLCGSLVLTEFTGRKYVPIHAAEDAQGLIS